MDSDYSTFETLKDERTRKVFSRVAKDKTVRFNDLVRSFGSAEEVSTALKSLTRVNLVKQKSSIIRDFDAYVITADGLRAARKVDAAA